MLAFHALLDGEEVWVRLRCRRRVLQTKELLSLQTLAIENNTKIIAAKESKSVIVCAQSAD